MELFTEIHSRLPPIGDGKVCRKRIVVLLDMILLQCFRERRDPGFRPNWPVPHIETSNSDEKEKNEYFVKYVERIRHFSTPRGKGFRDGCNWVRVGSPLMMEEAFGRGFPATAELYLSARAEI
jgi:hypothetical protein